MRRREFIAGLGTAVAWPPPARAQQADRVRRVGMLIANGENDPFMRAQIAAFREGLAKLGWTEGRNLRIDLRFAENDRDRVRYAAELVSLAPDVIVAGSAAATRAVQQQMQSISIVFWGAGDVFENGIVKNIEHPEGNTTGVTNLFASIGSKWLELLKEAAPRLARVGLVVNPQNYPDTSGYGYFPAIDQAARAFDVQAIRVPFRSTLDIVRAVDAFAAEPNGGLMVLPPAPSPDHRKAILDLAIQHRLPTIFPDSRYVAEGGLMSYGSANTELARRASFYVDRILRGAKVSELPVEYPTKFELVINLKTAKAIGLTIPEPFLLRADELIE